MGAVIWMIAAVATLWFGLTYVLLVDSLLFTATMIMVGVFGIKAAADGVDAIKGMAEDFRADDDY